ncbi:MAG: EF-hand domain-containing protein [archaeon]|nr:EF-hand domain-containing protein [archaeon]
MAINAVSILSDFQIAEFKEVFEIFDIDKDGEVSTSELKLIFWSLGQHVNDSELKQMIDKVDKDGNHTLDFAEFLSLMADKFVRNDENYKYYEIFRYFDKDGSGTISPLELKIALMKFTNKEDAIDKIMAEADEDEDGEVSFSEFVRFMKKLPPEDEEDF